MIAQLLIVMIGLADPVTVVQFQYPASRVTVTTASGYVAYYTVVGDAPAELRRAYKVLELAEREVVITEALQLFRNEIIANDRRLEALRTARMASFLNQTSSPLQVFRQDYAGQLLLYVDPTLTMLVPESTLKLELGREIARDSRIERAIAAVDRLADAHYQLRQTLVSIAYPDPATRPAVARPGKIEVSRPGMTGAATARAVPSKSVAPPARIISPPATALEAAERAEKAAADAEMRAEARERKARAEARAAEQYYQLAPAEERGTARFYWIAVRDEWDKARREWEAARDKWQTARDALAAAQKNPSTPVAKPTLPVNTVARPR